MFDLFHLTHKHSGGDGMQIDHGGLAGLADDDHSQYHNDARGDARYAAILAIFAEITAGITSIPNAAWTPIPMTAEIQDPIDMHSLVTNTTRITIPKPGFWIIGGGASFYANATGVRSLGFRKNGGLISYDTRPNLGASINNDYTTSIGRYLALNDYIELAAYQNSGGALNITAVTFWCVLTK